MIKKGVRTKSKIQNQSAKNVDKELYLGLELDDKQQGVTGDASSITSDQLSIRKMNRSKSRSSAKLLYGLLCSYLILFGSMNMICWGLFQHHTAEAGRSPLLLSNLTSLLASNYFMATDSLISFLDVISITESHRRGLFTDQYLENSLVGSISGNRRRLLPETGKVKSIFVALKKRYEDISQDGLSMAVKLEKTLIHVSESLEQNIEKVVGLKFNINFESDKKDSLLQLNFERQFSTDRFSSKQLLALVYTTMNYGITMQEDVLHGRIGDNHIAFEGLKQMSYLLIDHAYPDLLDPMIKASGDLLKDLLEESSQNHDRFTLRLIGILLGLSALAIIPLLIFLCWFQRRLSNILASYCCLNDGDLLFELDLMSRAASIVTSSKIFILSARVNQVNSLMTADCTKAAIKGKWKANKLLKNKHGMRSTDGSEALVVNFPYRSIAWTMTAALVLSTTVVCVGGMLASIANQMKVSYQVGQTSVQSTSIVLECHRRLASMLIFAPYSAVVLNLTERFKTLPHAQKNPVEGFTNYWFNARTSLESLSEDQSNLEDIIYGDYCREILRFPDQTEKLKIARYEMCAKSSNLFGQKGFNQFLIYEDRLIEDLELLERQLLKALEGSTSLNENDRMKLLLDLWYDKKYVLLRSLHHDMYGFFLDATSHKFGHSLAQRLASLNSTVETYTGIIRSIVVIISLLIILPVGRSLQSDNAVALFSFDTMHPSTVASNQYIKAKFKSFFNYHASV